MEKTTEDVIREYQEKNKKRSLSPSVAEASTACPPFDAPADESTQDVATEDVSDKGDKETEFGTRASTSRKSMCRGPGKRATDVARVLVHKQILTQERAD